MPAVPEVCDKCRVMSERTGVESGPGRWLGPGEGLPVFMGVGTLSCLPLRRVLGSRKGGFFIEGVPNSCKKIQWKTISWKEVTLELHLEVRGAGAGSQAVSIQPVETAQTKAVTPMNSCADLTLHM